MVLYILLTKVSLIIHPAPTFAANPTDAFILRIHDPLIDPSSDHPIDMSSVYYPDYLQLDKILGAQALESDKHGQHAHDEMLFIVIHQAYELDFPAGSRQPTISILSGPCGMDLRPIRTAGSSSSDPAGKSGIRYLDDVPLRLMLRSGLP